ncbi:MAG: hypothetical protein DHS80DRAFT_23819 [Piptocephalis tieghemiana]|nr:MAG: hypothetical protein DHS80DRAFT_23819 [Piptocephalis tieghemiana]
MDHQSVSFDSHLATLTKRRRPRGKRDGRKHRKPFDFALSPPTSGSSIPLDEVEAGEGDKKVVALTPNECRLLLQHMLQDCGRPSQVLFLDHYEESEEEEEEESEGEMREEGEKKSEGEMEEEGEKKRDQQRHMVYEERPLVEANMINREVQDVTRKRDEEGVKKVERDIVDEVPGKPVHASPSLDHQLWNTALNICTIIYLIYVCVIFLQKAIDTGLLTWPISNFAQEPVIQTTKEEIQRNLWERSWDAMFSG